MEEDTAAQSQSRFDGKDLVSMRKEGDQEVFHEKINVTADRFMCELCKQTFANAFNLQNHEKRVHLKIKDVSCELCSYKGFSANDIWTHNLYKHTTAKSFKCTMCELAFKRACNLSEHMKRHNNGNRTKDFPCPICGKMFRDKFSTKKCARIHQSAGNFKCTVAGCDAEFKNGISYQSHMKRIHTARAKIFMCNECDKSFKIKSELKTHKYYKHEEREREFSCSVCPKKFISKVRMDRHLLSHGSEIFRCPFYGCKVTSNLQYYINHHYKRKHGRVSYKKTLDERLKHEREKEDRVACKICNRLIKKGNAPTTSMKVHLRRHENQTPLVCSFAKCSDEIYYIQSSGYYGFNVPKEYFEHLEEKHAVNMKTHKASVNFNCKLCGKVITLESARAAEGSKKVWYKNASAWSSILSEHITKDHMVNVDLKKDWELYFEKGQVSVNIRETTVDNKIELKKILTCLECKLCSFTSKSINCAEGEQIRLLVEHYCRDHFTEPLQSFVEKDLANNYCKICDKQYEFCSSMKRLMHVGFNHAELYPFLKEDSKIDLRPFVVKKVVVKEKQSYNCGECGKSCSNKGNLKLHMVYHSDKRLFPCNKCQKAFKTKRDLVVHDITHSGEQPFKCATCEKTFSQIANMQKHTKTLHDVIVQKCHDCGKEFQTRFDFISHLPKIAENRYKRVRKENQGKIGCQTS